MKKDQQKLEQLIKGKKVAFIGAGVSHKTLIKEFVELGAHVTLCDQKKSVEDFGDYAATIKELGIDLSLGENYLDGFKGQDIIMRTPGFVGYFEKPLQDAMAAGTMVTSEVELFFDFCPCEIVAVTGSDGKTTTTTLISKFYEAAGRRVHLGGNIGAALLPMLPEALSNGLCSLNPDVDRLTFTCTMDIDPAGRVLSYDIYPSVIHSHARLVYEDVTRLLETGEEAGFAPEVARDLRRMERLAQVLTEARMERGALDLDIDEAVITLDERGVPTSIEREERGIANRMIEEFMLKANECVAEFARLHEIPILYRVHEDPDPEKIQTFDAFLVNLGYRIRGSAKGKVHPKALQAVLDKAKGKPEEGLVSRLMLRSLQKARYCPQPLGHFGLAAPDYCHFTSPIRRYPDLFVHRALHLYFAGKSTARLRKRAEEYAQHCSEKERQAMEAERDVDDLKKAQYMLDHVGEACEGVISSVTSFGLFVELPNTVEGLIHISNLDDDYYTFVEKSYMLLGERKKKIYRLGDPIRVVVTAVDMSTRRVDFAVDDEKESGYTEEAKPVPRDADGRTGKKNKKGKKPPKRRTKGENKS